jgi:hypothetical protein
MVAPTSQFFIPKLLSRMNGELESGIHPFFMNGSFWGRQTDRFPYVVAIIARSTVVAMKRRGGKRWALIRPFPRVPCGWKAIHCPQRTVTNKAGQNPFSESNRVRTTKTKPFFDVGPQ